MKFKISKFLSIDVVVGYLSSTYQAAKKKVKVVSKKIVREDIRSSHFSLAEQQKCVVPMTYFQKLPRQSKRVLTIQEIFDKYEQAYNPIYLEAVKFLLEQVYLLSPDYSED